LNVSLLRAGSKLFQIELLPGSLLSERVRRD
jgi:hypothetical protein